MTRTKQATEAAALARIEGEALTGSRCQARRLELGWSQDQLATIAGVSHNAVRQLERGTVGRVKTVQLIAAALDVSPAWLAGWEK